MSRPKQLSATMHAFIQSMQIRRLNDSVVLLQDVFDIRVVKSDQANAYHFPRDTTSTKGIAQNEQEMHSTLDAGDVLIPRYKFYRRRRRAFSSTMTMVGKFGAMVAGVPWFEVLASARCDCFESG